MITAEVGSKAKLVCSVAGAVGTVVFTWYENRRELHSDGAKYFINSLVSIYKSISWDVALLLVARTMV